LHVAFCHSLLFTYLCPPLFHSPSSYLFLSPFRYSCPFLLCVIIDFALHFSSTFSALHTQRVILFGFILVAWLRIPLSLTRYHAISFCSSRALSFASSTFRLCECLCVKFGENHVFGGRFC